MKERKNIDFILGLDWGLGMGIGLEVGEGKCFFKSYSRTHLPSADDAVYLNILASCFPS